MISLGRLKCDGQRVTKPQRSLFEQLTQRAGSLSRSECAISGCQPGAAYRTPARSAETPATRSPRVTEQAGTRPPGGGWLAYRAFVTGRDGLTGAPSRSVLRRLGIRRGGPP